MLRTMYGNFCHQHVLYGAVVCQVYVCSGPASKEKKNTGRLAKSLDHRVYRVHGLTNLFFFSLLLFSRQ